MLEIADKPLHEAEAPLRKLKPSEALMIGAALRPQCGGTPFIDGRSCALGAMYEGATGRTDLEDTGQILDWLTEDYWPDMSFWIAEQIWERNDDGESRESIAAWLAEQGL
jgi:hypothetical protein